MGKTASTGIMVLMSWIISLISKPNHSSDDETPISMGSLGAKKSPWQRIHRHLRRLKARWRLHRIEWNAMEGPWQPPKEFEYIYDEEAIFDPKRAKFMRKRPDDTRTWREIFRDAWQMYLALWTLHPVKHPLWERYLNLEKNRKREKMASLIEELEIFKGGSQNIYNQVRDELLQVKGELDKMGIDPMKKEAKKVFVSRMEVLQESIKEFVEGYKRGAEDQERRKERDLRILLDQKDELMKTVSEKYEEWAKDVKDGEESAQKRPSASKPAPSKEWTSYVPSLDKVVSSLANASTGIKDFTLGAYPEEQRAEIEASLKAAQRATMNQLGPALDEMAKVYNIGKDNLARVAGEVKEDMDAKREQGGEPATVRDILQAVHRRVSQVAREAELDAAAADKLESAFMNAAEEAQKPNVEHGPTYSADFMELADAKFRIAVASSDLDSLTDDEIMAISRRELDRLEDTEFVPTLREVMVSFRLYQVKVKRGLAGKVRSRMGALGILESVSNDEKYAVDVPIPDVAKMAAAQSLELLTDDQIRSFRRRELARLEDPDFLPTIRELITSYKLYRIRVNRRVSGRTGPRAAVASRQLDDKEIAVPSQQETSHLEGRAPEPGIAESISIPELGSVTIEELEKLTDNQLRVIAKRELDRLEDSDFVPSITELIMSYRLYKIRRRKGIRPEVSKAVSAGDDPLIFSAESFHEMASKLPGITEIQDLESLSDGEIRAISMREAARLENEEFVPTIRELIASYKLYILKKKRGFARGKASAPYSPSQRDKNASSDQDVIAAAGSKFLEKSPSSKSSVEYEKTGSLEFLTDDDNRENMMQASKQFEDARFVPTTEDLIASDKMSKRGEKTVVSSSDVAVNESQTDASDNALQKSESEAFNTGLTLTEEAASLGPGDKRASTRDRMHPDVPEHLSPSAASTDISKEALITSKLVDVINDDPRSSEPSLPSPSLGLQQGDPKQNDKK